MKFQTEKWVNDKPLNIWANFSCQFSLG